MGTGALAARPLSSIAPGHDLNHANVVHRLSVGGAQLHFKGRSPYFRCTEAFIGTAEPAPQTVGGEYRPKKCGQIRAAFRKSSTWVVFTPQQQDSRSRRLPPHTA
jgi:hypothetical protein